LPHCASQTPISVPQATNHSHCSAVSGITDSLPNFPPRLKTLVLHMISSHHGKLTGKVWALDQRQLLNTKRWLGEGKK